MTKSATAVRTVALPSGEAVPVLGQGTWVSVQHEPVRYPFSAGVSLAEELCLVAE